MRDFNGYGRLLRSAIIVTMIGQLTAAWADDAPGFDRPGLGFAPDPLKRGEVAYEQGLPSWTLDHDDGTRSSQYSTDSLLRVGLGGALELQLGSTPFNRLSERDPGQATTVAHGRGDSTLGLKLGLPEFDPNWSWGLLGTVEFTDGAAAIRNDNRQYTLGLTFEQKHEGKRQWSYLLQVQQLGGRSSFLAAVDDTRHLSEHWSLYAEAAAEHADARNGMQIGGGVIWLPHSRLQFDAYWRRRVAGHANDWEAGLGVAMAFGH